MKYIDIVFDGPPDNDSAKFVEVENEHGESIKVGQWILREDGYWVLRLNSGADIFALYPNNR